MLLISCKEKSKVKSIIKNESVGQIENTIDFSKYYKGDNLLDNETEKISDSVYYDFYNQVLKENLTIIGIDLLVTKIDTIILKEIIEFSNKSKINNQKILLFNDYIKDGNSEKINLNEEDLFIFLKQFDLKVRKLKQSELKNEVITKTEYEKIEKSFDLNRLSSNEIRSFCKIYKPIFSKDLSIAIFTYDYIPFPREFSSGTYLFIKENKKWKVVKSIGTYTIS